MDACSTKGYQIDYTAFYPTRVNTICVCDRINSGVIGPDGNVYKCWEEIGDPKACIDNIGNNLVMNLPERYYDYMLFDPTLEEECSKCDILPICMGGGCPLRRSRDRVKDCEFQKESITNLILKSYKLIKS